jgi:GrpB protein
MNRMTLEERVRRAVQADIAIVSYDPRWPALFEQEREHLRSCLPHELLGRIEHFGSTAVPGLPARQTNCRYDRRSHRSRSSQIEDRANLEVKRIRLFLASDIRR